MIIELGGSGGLTVATCTGRLSGEGAEALFRQTAAALAPEAPVLLVDLGRVEYITSSAIGALVRLCKEVRDRDGSMAVAAPQERVRVFLEIAGVDALVRVARSRGEALRALGRQEEA